MEAERTALSVAPRSVVIPFADLAQAATSGLDCLKERAPTFEATVHEDNQGVLKLANPWLICTMIEVLRLETVLVSLLITSS